MKKLVRVRGITIGEGMPKICVPIVGETLEQLIEEANFLTSVELDIVEWRADFFEKVEDIEKVKVALKEIRSILADIPLIFTFRSAEEGGKKEINSSYYFELNMAIAGTGLVDIVDVELFKEEKAHTSLIDALHNHKVFVIVSNHDFDKTPAKEVIVARLRKAQELKGDILKIAVMPKKATEVLTLLDATNIMKEYYAERPIISMSMAGMGVISRFAGEVFGSDVTFGAATKASAPGQVPVAELKNVLTLLHSNL